MIISETKTQTGFEAYRGGGEESSGGGGNGGGGGGGEGGGSEGGGGHGGGGDTGGGDGGGGGGGIDDVAGNIWQALPRADRGGGHDEELLGEEVRAVGHVVRGEAVRVLAGGSFRTTTRQTLSGRNTTIGVPAEGTCSYDGLEPGTESARLYEGEHSS